MAVAAPAALAAAAMAAAVVPVAVAAAAAAVAALAALVALAAVALAAPARLVADTRSERILSLSHTHTGERLTVPYFADGGYLPEALSRLNHHLRDHRSGEECVIDPALFDVEELKTTGPLPATPAIPRISPERTVRLIPFRAGRPLSSNA